MTDATFYWVSEKGVLGVAFVVKYVLILVNKALHLISVTVSQ